MMTRTATARSHEHSAWLRSTAAKRVREITAQLKGLDTSAYGAIVAPLGTTGPPGSRADMSCDRCFALPVSGELQMFVHRATARIYLAGGLCSSCARKEGAR